MAELELGALTVAERMAYATVVGSMVAADDVVSSEELEALRGICGKLKLSDEDAETVVDRARTHDVKSVRASLAELRQSDFRFTLFSDCLLIAYADDALVEGEKQALSEIAAALDISAAQADALREYAEAAHAAAAGGDHAEHHRRGQEIAARLAAVGVPVGAVALASAAGLSIAGVTSGLAALAAGLGIASGFGAVLGLGIGGVLGVRWLHQRIVARREHGEKLRYQEPGSTLTLREGLEEFHSRLKNVFPESEMSSERARELFHCHDTCHVVFGCDTSPANELLIDTWSIFGTDVTLKDYAGYLRVPEAQKAFEGVGYMRALLESIRNSPKLFEIFLRTRQMPKRWPFYGGDAYLDVPLAKIREEFGIRIFD